MRMRLSGRMAIAGLIAAAAISLGACAPMVPLAPAQFTPLPAASAAGEQRIANTTEVRLGYGYTRRLAAGSRWRAVGSLPQGQVYRPVGTVFTIEGRQVHEAYLVVAADQLVGFYLPGEDHYSPLASPIPLSFGANP